MNGPGPRAALRIAVGALLAALSLTVTMTSPSVPAELVSVWSGFGMAAYGAGEALYDAKRGA